MKPIVRRPSLVFLGLLALAALAGTCLAGGLLDLEPEGPIAAKERTLLLATFVLMLLVLVPVIAMTIGFAWHYRASNHAAEYKPDWESSLGIELAIWLIPGAIVGVLAWLTWVYTHRLDPYKPVDPGVAALEVQVVALDWKWLFIYPTLNVATVNQLAIPVDKPISFAITSDTVMNSFFIPQLGGQIYAMAGMRTELHLVADKPGRFFGENTQYSGRGFPFQHFDVIAMRGHDFDAWVEQARLSPTVLDARRFRALEQPSIRHPVTLYRAVEPGLFTRIIDKYSSAMMPPAH